MGKSRCAPPWPVLNWQSRSAPKGPLLLEPSDPNLPACVSLSRQISSSRQPSRDGLPSPPQSCVGTNQDAPARSPVPALFFPRHYPCQQRLISLVGANVLGRFSMAGFEVIIYGRFWVIAEGTSDSSQPSLRRAAPSSAATGRGRPSDQRRFA